MHVSIQGVTTFYLNGSVHIRSFEAKVDLGGYRQADKQPVVETEVVDQLENVRHRQVDQRHATLQGQDHTPITTHTKTLFDFSDKQLYS